MTDAARLRRAFAHAKANRLDEAMAEIEAAGPLAVIGFMRLVGLSAAAENGDAGASAELERLFAMLPPEQALDLTSAVNEAFKAVAAKQRAEER